MSLRVLTVLWALLSFSTSVQAEIVDKVILNGVVYLLENSTNNRIHRFDTSTETFLTAIDLPSGTAIAFDTDNGTDFYAAVDNALLKLTVTETVVETFTGGTENQTEVIQTTLRRSDTIRDLDLNGNFLVVAYGVTGSEILSLTASEGVLVDRAPEFETEEEAEFQAIGQLNYMESFGQYLVRLNDSKPVIFLGFNSTSGTFGEYDAEGRLATEGTEGTEDKLFFSSDSERAISTSAFAYAITETSFGSMISDDDGPVEFISDADRVATDNSVDAVAFDDNDIYVAFTIDNPCNIRVNGTRISLYTVNGSNIAENDGRTIDLPNASLEITVMDNTLYSFYYNDAGDQILFESTSTLEGDEEWVDTTFDPNTEFFNLSQDKVKVMGDASVLLNIDEGCKHYIVEYDASTQAYGRQVEVNDIIPDYVIHEGQNAIYWARNTEDRFRVHVATDIEGEWVRVVRSRKRDGSVNKMAALDNHILVHSTEGSDHFVYLYDLNLNLVNFTSTPEFTIGSWDYIEWDSENQLVLFISGEKLYSWSLSDIDDIENTLPIESIHFGTVTSTVATQPFIINNVKTSPQVDLVYVAGNLFDLGSNGLLIDDVANTSNNLATWTGSALYTTTADITSIIEKWTFSLPGTGNLGLVSVSNQTGDNIALVTVTLDGTPTPLLITRVNDTDLSFITSLDSSAEVVENNNSPDDGDSGESGEGSGDSGDPGSSDSTDDTCSAVVCGDESGGAVNLFSLFVLLLLGSVRVSRSKRFCR